MIFDFYGYALFRAGRQPALLADGQTAQALLAVPLEARYFLWQGLARAIAGALEVYESMPPGARYELPIFSIQHTGRPQFDEVWLREQTQENWHRLMGVELRLTVEVLERLVFEEKPVLREMLAEQCARIGQLYREFTRRAGTEVALPVLCWELHLLRYRASPAVAPLIYE